MRDEPPKVTTLRLPESLHSKVYAAADKDHRSFNAEVIVLLESALLARGQAHTETENVNG